MESCKKLIYLFQFTAKIMAKIPLAINMTFWITSSFTFFNSFQLEILNPKCLLKIFLHFFCPLSNLPLKSRSNLKSNFSLIFDLNRTTIRVKMRTKVTKMADKPMAMYVDWFWSFSNGWISNFNSGMVLVKITCIVSLWLWQVSKPTLTNR